MDKKVLVKSGIRSNSIPKKKNFTVDSTAGTFQLLPVFYQEMLPKGKINCDNGLFYVQANAMSVPSMAKYNFRFHQFFVPYKYIWPAWEDFFVKNVHYYPATDASTPTAPSVPHEVPYICQSDLLAILLNSSFQLTQATPVGQTHDFVVLNADNTISGYQFTRKGIAAFKLLEHLGYKLSFKELDKDKLEILTLLSFGKIFLDYYYPSNYAFVGTDFYTCYQAFTTDLKDVQAAPGHNVIYYNAIGCILNAFTYVYFNNSPFYDAWDNPVAPNNGGYSAVSFDDATNNAPNNIQTVGNVATSNPSAGYQPSNGTVFVGTNGTSGGNVVGGVLTDYIVKMLHKAQNFVTRYQLAGSRLIDRWLAYLGVSLPDSHRAIKLGDFSVPLKIGEVVATSDSVNGTQNTNSSVGDKAGKGANLVDGLKFSFENERNTHGVYMILMSVVLDNYIVSGIDRARYRSTAMDYIQPEFDGMAPAMVYQSEVFTSMNGTYNDASKGKFGFMPNGYEHCIDRHIMSGALTCGSFGADALKGWFPRKYFGTPYQSNVTHSLGFMHANTVDLDSANLPFYDRTYSENFIFTCQWLDIELRDSKKSLREVFDFVGDEVNDAVEIDSGGTRLN